MPVDIRARIEGFIEQRPFAEGQTVRQWQDLFLIEEGAYEAALAAARASLAGAQAALRDAEGRLQRNQELRRTQAKRSTWPPARFRSGPASRVPMRCWCRVRSPPSSSGP